MEEEEVGRERNAFNLNIIILSLIKGKQIDSKKGMHDK